VLALAELELVPVLGVEIRALGERLRLAESVLEIGSGVKTKSDCWALRVPGSRR